MIRLPTVFVLGAGASIPYGFPSGAKLREWICNAINEDDWIAKELKEKVEFDPDEIKTFARTFLRSNINSIDAFLLRRPQFNQIGKFAIAAHLCRLEIPEKLYTAPDEYDWYRLLWNHMVADAETARDVERNEVRFISFNYDRRIQ